MENDKNKRTEQIHLRVTPAEKQKIIWHAFNAKMNMSQYIVALSENKPIVVIDDIADLVVQIIRVGTNINQIAKIANSQKFMRRDDLEQIKENQKEVEKKLEAILQMVNRSARR